MLSSISNSPAGRGQRMLTDDEVASVFGGYDQAEAAAIALNLASSIGEESTIVYQNGQVSSDLNYTWYDGGSGDWAYGWARDEYGGWFVTFRYMGSSS